MASREIDDMDWLKSPKKQFKKEKAPAADDQLAALMAPSDESTGRGVLNTEDFVNLVSLEVATAGDEMVSEIGKVFLMQIDDRYLPYNLQVIGKHIVFTSQKNRTQQYHLLSGTHIHSVDSKNNKIVDNSG